jgi:hypothetical protein
MIIVRLLAHVGAYVTSTGDVASMRGELVGCVHCASRVTIVEVLGRVSPDYWSAYASFTCLSVSLCARQSTMRTARVTSLNFVDIDFEKQLRETTVHWSSAICINRF